jgi:hypothetical protein
VHFKYDFISFYNGKAVIGAPDVSGNDLHCLLSFFEYIDVHRFRVNVPSIYDVATEGSNVLKGKGVCP